MRRLRHRYGHAAHAEIISTRKTFDGVTVHLHADGSVSDRLRYVAGGKLPADKMWRVWGDVELYEHAELPQLIRDVKKGHWKPFYIRKGMTEAQREAARAHNAKYLGVWHDGTYFPRGSVGYEEIVRRGRR